MSDSLLNLSQRSHDLVFHDESQSWCARAFARRNLHWFWAAWVWVFGFDHCGASALWHHLFRHLDDVSSGPGEM